MPGEVPRPEYPRPQFQRREWQCLNGTWQFEMDPGDSGAERGLLARDLTGAITVPFCPESRLSGIEDVDFHPAVWYRRRLEVPSPWEGRRLLLHFQAVDHDATVWADGCEVARHRGGFTGFTCDLGARRGALDLVVRARDPKRGPQARGKQAVTYANEGVRYTRTTGIWQTVWWEPVPQCHMRRPRVTPNVATASFHVTVPLSSNRPGTKLRAVLSGDEVPPVVAETRADLDLAPSLDIRIPPAHVHYWQPGSPYLYQLHLSLIDGDGIVVDEAQSYAGLRSVAIDGHVLRLNGAPVFQRLVLDQGYYPDGIMTAPDDQALVHDIELAQAAGFNGARLHQKVFEERFLYHADRAGYLVWGEFGDWGAGTAGPPDNNQLPTASFITQWLEVLERDYSHPSIVGWCPLNETAQDITDHLTVLDDVTRGMFLATKAMDPTRPVLDASGYSHRVVETDVYDSHHYEQDPARFADDMAGLEAGAPFVNAGPEGRAWSVPYRGQPYFCSEFGGTWWGATGDTTSWGYGSRPGSEEDFMARFAGLCGTLLGNPRMFGYCYTQLTDVFQEKNGLYDFQRRPKLDISAIAAVQRRSAAIESTAGRVDVGG